MLTASECLILLQPETQHEIKPVVMTKEAWKHKDGASGKDSALLAQLNALKDQARADAVEIKPKRLDLPDGEDTSATDASTTDSANVRYHHTASR